MNANGFEEPRGVADIGQAMRWLKGGQRVKRLGWNGVGTWLAYVEPGDWNVAIADHPMDHKPGGSGIVQPSNPFIVCKQADGKLVPWNCWLGDLMATDWMVVGKDGL